MARNGKSNQNKKNKQKTTSTVEVKPVETVKTVEKKKPVPAATEEPSKSSLIFLNSASREIEHLQ